MEWLACTSPTWFTERVVLIFAELGLRLHIPVDSCYLFAYFDARRILGYRRIITGNT